MMCRRFRCWILLSAFGCIGGTAAAQPTVFLPLTEPTGVATDPGGAVYAFSQSGFSILAQRLTPAAQQEWQKELVDFSLFAADVRAAVGPGTGLVLAVYQHGAVVQFKPDTGEYRGFIDLRNLPDGAAWDTTRILDMSIPEVRDLSANINLATVRFGDVAARRDGDTLELWVTLRSGKTPYLGRLRTAVTPDAGFILPQPPVDARLLVTSTRAVSSNTTIPRGVAVNGEGTVVTSLPLLKTDGGHPEPALARDVLVCLRADFEPRDFPSRASIEFESANRCLELPCKVPVAMYNNAEFAAEGADADAAGNFFLSSGYLSAAIHSESNGAGGMLILSKWLTQHVGVNVGQAAFDARDIAVTRDGANAYLTGVGGFFDTGAVVALPIVSIPADPPVVDPGSGDGSSDAGGDGSSDSGGTDIGSPGDGNSDGTSDAGGDTSGDSTSDAGNSSGEDNSNTGADSGGSDAGGDSAPNVDDNTSGNGNDNVSDAFGPPRSAAGSAGGAGGAAAAGACPTAAVVLIAGLGALAFANRRARRER